jgi:uncharacterized membrane protein (DUF106 family)
MKMIYLTILVLAVFIAVWIFFVVPAERRHHERKLESVRKRIEQRQAAVENQQYSGDDSAESH